MCLPDPTLLSLCEDLMRMGEESKRLKPPCQLCREGDPCWWHKPFVPSFEERAHG